MFQLNGLMLFAVFSAIGLIIYLFYDYILKPRKMKSEGKAVRIFLYENIGGKPVYIGEKVAYEENDKAIGTHLLIKKLKVPLKRISNSDFIQDKEYGKALHVVRFAEDDYRPLVRLNGEKWYRKELVPIMEEVTIINEETGEEEIIEQQKKDKKTDEYLYNEEYVKYDEPLGINQKDRDVLMFNRTYHLRMDEKFKIAESKWSKMLPLFQIAVVGMILLIAFIYMTQSMNKTQLEISSKWDENAKAILNEQNDANWIESVAEKVRKKNDEVNAPPT